jgi:hypothetical protein
MIKSFTPMVTTDISSGYASTILTISASAFYGKNDVLSNIYIGNTPCLSCILNITSSTTATWRCTIPPLPASRYSIFVSIWPFGYAILSNGNLPQFTHLNQVGMNGHKLVQSSVAGGAPLSLVGKGLSYSTLVRVCGQECVPTFASYGLYNCSLPALRTVESVKYFDKLNITRDLVEILTGTIFSTSSSSQNRAFDGNYGTWTANSGANCYIGVQLPKGILARPFRMRYYPTLQYSNKVHGVVFEGSANGGLTYDVLGYGTTAHEGWNFVDPSGNYSLQWYSRFRYRATGSNYCYLAEIQFLGVSASASSTCEVSVAIADVTRVIGNVSYNDLSYTPLLTSIQPTDGTALGGTLLSINGSNFLSTSINEPPEVYISGVPCNVQSWTSVKITCITGPRSVEDVLPTSLNIFIPGRGYSISSDTTQFMYIDRWSDLTSWKNQEPPVDGDIVWVPEGQVIMLDQNTPVLSSLLIEGSLYFDVNKDITLDAVYIFVKGGIMQIGTHEEPYEKKATITLHGDRFGLFY